MIFYAMLSGASIGELFIGGIVPALLLALVLMVYVFWISRRRGYPLGQKLKKGEWLPVTLKALPALMIVVILLGGIYGGAVTPTETGAIAALYGLLISYTVYKALGWAEMKSIFKDSVQTIASLSLLVVGAYTLSYIVSLEEIPQLTSRLLDGFEDKPLLLLLIINAVFLILGMLLDTTVLLLVFVPIVLPVVKLAGIDPVFFGVVIVLNMMIGLSTPPFGLLVFITSSLAKTPLHKVMLEIMPMVFLMLAVLLLIVLFPVLVLGLPGWVFS